MHSLMYNKDLLRWYDLPDKGTEIGESVGTCDFSGVAETVEVFVVSGVGTSVEAAGFSGIFSVFCTASWNEDEWTQFIICF